MGGGGGGFAKGGFLVGFSTVFAGALQHAPQDAPETFQAVPRRSKDSPKTLPSTHKTFQDTPRTPKTLSNALKPIVFSLLFDFQFFSLGRPKTPQNAPGRLKPSQNTP